MKKSEALKILGLSEGASDEAVKKAHRKKVVENHPDRYAQNDAKKVQAEEQTKLINEARDVLLSRKWDPEFDPRRSGTGTGYSGYPGYNPYVQRPTSGGAQGNGQDPFEGFPFDFDYVWTGWPDGTSTQSGQQGKHAAGANPYDPFASVYTQRPTKTAAQEAEEARKNLQFELAGIGVKLAALAVCTLLSGIASGMFIYVLASVALGIYRQFQGCSWFVMLPLLFIFGPFISLLMPRMDQTLSYSTIVCFGIAILFDISIIRHAVAAYRTCSEKAKVS